MLDDIIKEKLAKLPKISQIMAQGGLSAKKSLGQNFLVDETVVRHIVNSSKIVEDMPVLEIGPGLGSLTREIIYKGVLEIHLVEKDERFVNYLEVLANIHPNLKIYQQDALRFEERKIIAHDSSKKIQIIANLPYNIGTSLILKWLAEIDTFLRITVMLQKEVAGRITALPDTSAYGSLSILVQVLCDVEHIIDIPPSAFIPKPKIDSSVISIFPKSTLPEGFDLKKLEAITKAAFSERRKMVRKTLSSCFKEKLEEVFEKCRIKPTARAQELSPTQYVELSKLL